MAVSKKTHKTRSNTKLNNLLNAAKLTGYVLSQRFAKDYMLKMSYAIHNKIKFETTGAIANEYENLLSTEEARASFYSILARTFFDNLENNSLVHNTQEIHFIFHIELQNGKKIGCANMIKRIYNDDDSISQLIKVPLTDYTEVLMNKEGETWRIKDGGIGDWLGKYNSKTQKIDLNCDEPEFEDD